MKILSKSFMPVCVSSMLLLYSNMASASIPADVPEPGPIGLLILGGVGLLIARRFRRNK